MAWGRLRGRACGALADAVAARDTAQIDLNISLAMIARKEAELPCQGGRGEEIEGSLGKNHFLTKRMAWR